MTPTVLVIALILIGLMLLAVEVVVLPGFGIMGILGAIAIIAAGWIAVTELSTLAGVAAVGGGVFLGGLMMWLLPKTRVARGMVLETAHRGQASDPALEKLVGQEGVATTPLRPAGAARIGEQLLDVVTDGQYVEQGTAVRVTQVEGSRIVIKPLN